VNKIGPRAISSPAFPVPSLRPGTAGESKPLQAGDFSSEALPHLDRIYSLARALAKPPMDPEDLTQETFARACAAYERFTPGSDVRAWLSTILINLIRGQARQRPLQIIPVADPQAAAADNCEVIALRNIERSSVLAAVHKLPEEFRMAICLVDLAGLTVKEAAEVLDVPRGTVLSRLSRGRAKLAVLLHGLVDTRRD
jgi:RNA polymerase sigma-70 factor, ECF subfamily